MSRVESASAVAPALRSRRIAADDRRRIAGAEETGPERRRVDLLRRGDAHVIRQRSRARRKLLRQRAGDRRIRHVAHRRMARAHQVRAAGVVAFLRAQRAHDRQLIGVLGQLRQVLAEPQPRNARREFFELAAVGVAGLHVERVGLARPAAHPEQDAMPVPARILRDLGRQRRQPTRAARAQQAQPHGAQHVAAMKMTAVTVHDDVLTDRPQKGTKSHKKQIAISYL